MLALSIALRCQQEAREHGALTDVRSGEKNISLPTVRKIPPH